jgi:hypothetical protein
MPVHRGQDTKGPFYQWGNHGKKYYYKAGDKASRERALAKSNQQARAIYAHGYRGK